MIGFTLQGQPRTKKNHQKIAFNRKTGRQFVRQSDAYVKYEKDAVRQLTEQGLAGIGIDYPVNVAARFYCGDRRKRDLTNLLEAIDDVMVKAGVLVDDNSTIIESHDGSRVLYDKECPRTVVFIERKEETDDPYLR